MPGNPVFVILNRYKKHKGLIIFYVVKEASKIA